MTRTLNIFGFKTLGLLCLLLLGAVLKPCHAQAVYVPLPKSPATFIVAASNSSAAAKAGADYICSGTADQSVINAAIAAVPSAGGKVVLRTGQYNLTGSVIIDRSYVDLEGESHPHWGGFIHAWSSTASPNGLEGNNSSKLKASGNFSLISINSTNVPDGGESRHRGVRIAKLYLYGNNYTGVGISGGNTIDVSIIEDCFIQHVLTGMNVSMDTGTIRDMDIQDCAGDAIIYGGYLGHITQNLCYDIGGNGITISGADAVTISSNNVGDCLVGVLLNAAPSASVTGNTFRGSFSSACLQTIGGSGDVITGNAFIASYGLANFEGISIGNPTATPGCCVSGNTISFSGGTTGYAIAFRGLSTGGVANGNAISGAGWHGGSGTTVYWYTPSNVVATNAGDNAVGIPLPVGPVAQTSALWIAWYKAGSLSLANGAAVTTWLDSSGSGQSVSPNTSNPLYVAAEAGANGQPGITFNGTSDAFFNTSLSAQTSGVTVFIVAKESSIRTTGPASLFNATPGGMNATFIDSTQHLDAYAGAALVGPAFTPTTWHVLEYVFNGASTKIQVDGGTATTGNAGTNLMTGGLVIGANNARSAEWFNGDIAEIAAASGVMSTADRSAARQALGTKYGITVTP